MKYCQSLRKMMNQDLERVPRRGPTMNANDLGGSFIPPGKCKKEYTLRQRKNCLDKRAQFIRLTCETPCGLSQVETVVVRFSI
jgi:hypothetical protein